MPLPYTKNGNICRIWKRGFSEENLGLVGATESGVFLSDIHFSILHNGLDFVTSSLEQITDKDGDNRNLKYAAIHLWSGVLLIMKERIAREHWTLLFANPDKISQKAFEQGDFQSIGYEQIRKILKEVCTIEINRADHDTLKNLQNKRNRIEHFEFVDTKDSLSISVARVLNFLIDFIDEHLAPDDFEENEQLLYSQLKDEVVSFESFVNERMSVIQPQLDLHDGLIVFCLACDLKTTIRNKDADKYHCLFCKKESDDYVAISDLFLNNELGVDSYSTVKDGGEYPQYECFECGDSSLIPIMADYSKYHCFCCSSEWRSDELDSCSRCGVLILSDETSVCQSCAEYAMRD